MLYYNDGRNIENDQTPDNLELIMMIKYANLMQLKPSYLNCGSNLVELSDYLEGLNEYGEPIVAFCEDMISDLNSYDETDEYQIVIPMLQELIKDVQTMTGLENPSFVEMLHYYSIRIIERVVQGASNEVR